MYTRTQVLCIRMQGSYPAFRQYLKCATGPRRHASRLSFSTDPQVTYLNRLLSFLEEDSGDSGIVAGCIRPSYANLIAAGGWKIKLKNTYYVGFLVLRYVAKGGPINLRKLRRCFFSAEFTTVISYATSWTFRFDGLFQIYVGDTKATWRH